MFAIFLLAAASQAQAQSNVATYRGNLARTGCADGVAGPLKPKVLWARKSADHYLASPVIVDKTLYLASIGALNTSNLTAFAIEGKDEDRVQWSKSSPYLKLPIASAPTVHDGLVVFGDGMHQTNGAVLHCLRAATGRPLWQYQVPGDLVHLEGSPTIAEGRAYIGGGNAGVICVDMSRLTLDGKELDLASIEKLLDAKWQELQAKYEEEKKKDPDFAVPPTEDSLPKPRPALVWQQGKDHWHVDAPVAVTGGKVLAASAFLDEERVGKRALFCLDAKTGDILWDAPIKHNAWAGPTVAGETVVVGSSNIRFDQTLAFKGQGEVAALNLADGKPKWQRKVTGGVLSPVCVHSDLAIFTATDGKVRALDMAEGRLKWSYEANSPMFAGVAVDGKSVYAADLNGIVHCIDMTNGAKRWTLNLGSDPAVKAPGMVYGSPTLAGGKLYVATCNINRQPQDCAIVCIGEE
jgi:outer membrane protein assembly factor BamB